jgi:hypothetical protein
MSNNNAALMIAAYFHIILFSLAYFISLYNDDPADKLYVQDEMRQPFNLCIANENIVDFTQREKKKTQETVQLK